MSFTYGRFIGILITLSLTISCATPISNTRSSSKQSTVSIRSQQHFNALIIDKTLTGTTIRGLRSPETQIIFKPNGKIIGFNSYGNIDLNWYWKNGTICRSGTVGLPDNPILLQEGCHSLTLKKGIARFDRASGNARRAIYFVE